MHTCDHRPTRAPSTGYRLVITGGGGFIGAEVSHRLARAGHEVTIIDHGADPRHDRARHRLGLRPDNQPPAGPVAWLADDLHQVDLVRLLAGVDRVVHLAGRPGVQTSWGRGAVDHLADNAVLTDRVLAAALAAGVGRVVLASTSSVYGNIATGQAAESRAVAPVSPYGWSKVVVEQLAAAYATRGLPVVALRLFTVYGRHQRPTMAVARMIGAARGGAPFPLRGAGHQQRDLVHVEDVAAAIEAALRADVPPGVVANVAGGRPVALNEVRAELEALLGVRVPTVTVPARPGDPDRTAADLTRSHQLLDWRPRIGLAQGLADQVSALEGADPTAVGVGR